MDRLWDWVLDLTADLSAAGLDAKPVGDPDRGPGVWVGAPAVSWPDQLVTACGDITKADVRVLITIVGAGWTREQVSALVDDAQLALAGILRPWRPTDPGLVPVQTAAGQPAYTLTVTR